MFQRLYLLYLLIFNVEEVQRCRLNSRNHFGEPLPVIIKDGKLLEPTDRYGNVDLTRGENLTLSCEGSGHLYHPSMNHEEITATITCDTGEYFTNNAWLNGSAGFTSFRCSYPPPHVSERTNRTCFQDNRIYEVGYRIQNEWYPIYESCFDENRLNAIYSKYTQKPYNANYQTRVERPYFIDDNNIYRSVGVESLFSPKGQKNGVANLVGSRVNSYFVGDQLLSRGHLAAKTDFVYAFGERATFHYVNCAPQWTGFNGGNWNTLEVDLRNHVNYANYYTIIYTGTYGVSSLMNDQYQRVHLYLTEDYNNNQVVPVPEYFYKVVYEPSTQKGIAFIGINNPYYSVNEAVDMFFCPDLCRGGLDLSWLSWHPNNPSEGFTFCCSVPDFRQTVRHLPHFEVTGLLTYYFFDKSLIYFLICYRFLCVPHS
ncbi:uncharacterized protein LOC128672645 [Plodia interpunctella]|uniref:uncharacterized protein LOC128672645 n=1 Tax=Plodia interpunctella TaxID=58824 RepID=UPI002367C0A1|nr:uncharacterized protein LOC128672645 [Plodia interpunctella]